MFYVKNERKVEQNSFLGTSYAINLQDPALMSDFHQFNVHVQCMLKGQSPLGVLLHLLQSDLGLHSIS